MLLRRQIHGCTNWQQLYCFILRSSFSTGKVHGNKTHEVGTKQANAWGLFDMHGNVWEWCSDWYGGYPNGAVTDHVDANTGSYRVSRGSSWINNAERCRSASQFNDTSGYRDYNLGFRLSLVSE